MSPRTLVVMRHAKAEVDGPTDFERPLAARGAADARAAGTWLTSQGIGPDHAAVSAARRTQETWRALAEGAGWEVEPTLDEGLYAAGTDTALDLLRLLDDDARCTVVLGHNPTMASLATLLDDGEGDVEAGNQLVLGYPTCALAVFDVDLAWADLGPGTATLRAFHVGRAD